MWGLVIVICSLVRFAELQFEFRLPFDIYMLTYVAVIPQIYFSIREKKRRKVRTYDDRFQDGLWLAFGISIALLIFIVGRLYREWDPVNDQFDSNFCDRNDDEVQTHVLGWPPLLDLLYCFFISSGKNRYVVDCFVCRRRLADPGHHHGKRLSTGQKTFSQYGCLKTWIRYYILNSGWP